MRKRKQNSKWQHKNIVKFLNKHFPDRWLKYGNEYTLRERGWRRNDKQK